MQESFIIINRIATGFVLMNEASLYSARQIIGICLTSSITIVGIVIIAKKHHFLSQDQLKKKNEIELK